MPDPIKVFISYAHANENYKNELKKHFAPMIRNKEVLVWDDRQISPGINWDNEIHEKLYAANIIIMLISPDFLDSEYIYGQEFSIALNRHRKEAWAIGVIVEDCLWEVTDIAKFQMLPIDAKPIAVFPKAEVNSVYKDIVKKVIRVASEFVNNKKWIPSDSTPTYYIVPMPHKKYANVNEEFYTKAMPYLADRLYEFARYSDKMIAEQKQSYDWANASSIDKVESFLTFLQLLSRTVNKMLFHWGGVRTHFRFLHTDKDAIKKDKEYYYKLAAAFGGIDIKYALTPIPSIDEGMIYYAILYNQPLIYYLNPENHYDKKGRKTLESKNFKDYITFVLVDDSFKKRNKYLLSMGISFEEPEIHRNLCNLLCLCRFDEVISAVIKLYAKETNIDVANILVDNQNYIYEKFYKDYEG